MNKHPDPAAEACTCELCRALLALAESAVRNRAAAEAREQTEATTLDVGPSEEDG